MSDPADPDAARREYETIRDGIRDAGASLHLPPWEELPADAVARWHIEREERR